jgi:hypothetical protein
MNKVSDDFLHFSEWLGSLFKIKRYLTLEFNFRVLNVLRVRPVSLLEKPIPVKKSRMRLLNCNRKQTGSLNAACVKLNKSFTQSQYVENIKQETYLVNES